MRKLRFWHGGQFLFELETDDEVNYSTLAMEMLEKDIGLFAHKMYIKHLDPEDIAQELRLHIWSKLDKYDPKKAKFNTWSWRVMKNCLISMTRKRNYKLEFFPYDDAFPDEELIDSEVNAYI